MCYKGGPPIRPWFPNPACVCNTELHENIAPQKMRSERKLFRIQFYVRWFLSVSLSDQYFFFNCLKFQISIDVARFDFAAHRLTVCADTPICAAANPPPPQPTCLARHRLLPHAKSGPAHSGIRSLRHIRCGVRTDVRHTSCVVTGFTPGAEFGSITAVRSSRP